MEQQEVKKGKETVAGSVELELDELRRLQEHERVARIETITVSCSGFLTIICC